MLTQLFTVLIFFFYSLFVAWHIFLFILPFYCSNLSFFVLILVYSKKLYIILSLECYISHSTQTEQKQKKMKLNAKQQKIKIKIYTEINFFFSHCVLWSFIFCAYNIYLPFQRANSWKWEEKKINKNNKMQQLQSKQCMCAKCALSKFYYYHI